eukprot:7914546-Karenia_brevis.AAC.1
MDFDSASKGGGSRKLEDEKVVRSWQGPPDIIKQGGLCWQEIHSGSGSDSSLEAKEQIAKWCVLGSTCYLRILRWASCCRADAHTIRRQLAVEERSAAKWYYGQ